MNSTNLITWQEAKACAIAGFDSAVAALFPPHPCAAAPSDELGELAGMSPAVRRIYNKQWGRKKAAALAEYQSKKNK